MSKYMKVFKGRGWQRQSGMEMKKVNFYNWLGRELKLCSRLEGLRIEMKIE